MTLDELRAKQLELARRGERLRAQLVSNEEQRAALAFDAECGVAAARKEINDLVKGAAALDAEAKTVDAALVEAAKRIVAAEVAERDEAQRSAARTALEMLDVFEARGAALSAKLNDFVAEYTSLCADFRQLEKVGFAPTTYALIASNMKRAASTALMFTDLRQDFLAPKDRTTFDGVVRAWASNVRLRATATLNRSPKN